MRSILFLLQLQIDRADAALNLYMILSVAATTKISNCFSVNGNVSNSFLDIDFMIFQKFRIL